MTNLIPTSLFQGKFSEQVVDKESAIFSKSQFVWVFPIPKDNVFIREWTVEESFNYPKLSVLRKEFQKTSLYSEKELDEIVKVYERLPNYQKGRKSTSRS